MGRVARLGVIANPENRRCESFLAAVQRRGLPRPEVVSWAELIAGKIPTADFVRIDSAGENEGVRRALVALGGGDAEGCEPGRIWGMAAGALGMRRALQPLTGRPCSIPPYRIATLFDKARCQEITAAVARTPSPVGMIDDLDGLLRTGVSRAFLKPLAGSSASGVLAFERAGDRLQITCSVELVREPMARLYNNLRVRKYRDPADIAQIIALLAPEGLYAERWVPKAGIGGRSFDLRVLVIDGRARHVVVRTANGPLTNLHLGNQRGSIEAVRERYPRGWADAMGQAEAAAGVMPDVICLGVDVVVGLDGKAYVIELNAFGDLLPGVVHQGQDPWDAQLDAYLTHSQSAG